jgi:hypothetical protein
VPAYLNVRESYALGSHATVFQSEVYGIFWRVRNIAFFGGHCQQSSICSDSIAALLALKPYGVSSRVVLYCCI